LLTEEEIKIWENLMDGVMRIFTLSGARSSARGLWKGSGSDVSDEHGHSVPITFRENPHEVDIIEKLHEIAPKGMFKTRSDFNRVIFRVGLYIMTQLLEEKVPDKVEDVNELRELHSKLMTIYRMERIIELNGIFDKLRKSMINNGAADTKKLAMAKELEEEFVTAMSG